MIRRRNSQDQTTTPELPVDRIVHRQVEGLRTTVQGDVTNWLFRPLELILLLESAERKVLVSIKGDPDALMRLDPESLHEITVAGVCVPAGRPGFHPDGPLFEEPVEACIYVSAPAEVTVLGRYGLLYPEDVLLLTLIGIFIGGLTLAWAMTLRHRVRTVTCRHCMKPTLTVWWSLISMDTSCHPTAAPPAFSV